jgi:hypothetical protein
VEFTTVVEANRTQKSVDSTFPQVSALPRARFGAFGRAHTGSHRQRQPRCPTREEPGASSSTPPASGWPRWLMLKSDDVLVD